MSNSITLPESPLYKAPPYVMCIHSILLPAHSNGSVTGCIDLGLLSRSNLCDPGGQYDFYGESGDKGNPPGSV